MHRISNKGAIEISTIGIISCFFQSLLLPVPHLHNLAVNYC